MNETATTDVLPATPPPLLAGGMRSRDLAQSMGISEAELYAAHDGPEVVRLADDMRELIMALPQLGTIMSLTRNEAAVHEKVGEFGNISLGKVHGLVLNGAIDQRLFPNFWRYAFAVEMPGERGLRRSLQFFDKAGDAVLKVHLRPESDHAAFAAFVARFRNESASPVTVGPVPERSDRSETADVEAFRRDFVKMQDIHEFFPLLMRHGMTRRGALDMLEDRYVCPLPSGPARRLLESASESGLPIMCFVGSRGCIQIHTGPVKNINVMGPWLNVLDPGFNLHLREDFVAETWSVRKPTRHGPITSVEMYDRDRSLIAQFFGVREPKEPENPDWARLVEALVVPAM